MWDEAAITRAAELACTLEADAHKPGNVTPRHAFADMTHADLVASARAIAPVMGEAGDRRVGETILEAVRATRRVARCNTNLGTVLLMAPLARAAALSRKGGERASGRGEPLAGEDGWPTGSLRRELRGAAGEVLRGLDRADADLAYRAIRLASPGGMGRVPEQDLEAEPTVSLLDAMRLAAARDAVAREYVTDFEITFVHGLPLLGGVLARGVPVIEAAVELFVGLLARVPDSLIQRKFGEPAAAEVSKRAALALSVGAPGSAARRRELDLLDAWLRHPGRRWNPGTSADLVAATLFVWLLTAAAPDRLVPPSLRASASPNRLRAGAARS